MEEGCTTPFDEEAGDERPPICSACGVTMVPAVLSASGSGGEWVCLECEETDGGA